MGEEQRRRWARGDVRPPTADFGRVAPARRSRCYFFGRYRHRELETACSLLVS